jgi:citrate lyase subunit beta / citryl-CoA lyase
MKKDFLFRSCLFVPGHNERLLLSATRSSADVLLLDLEDSVQPGSNKQIARDMIKKQVTAGDFSSHHIFPRVNDRESGFLLKDVFELTIEGVDGFMYPKSQKGEDVYFFDKLLETIEAEKGIELGTFKIIPLIETTSAIMHLQEICSISKRVVAIAFGCEDYITDLGGIHDKAGDSIFTARSLIAAAAKANGIVPIDTVHINIHDLEDLEENLKLAKNLGFEGMLNLHPKELELAHRYFSPSENQVSAAKEMIELYEEAISEDKGVAVINGKFIGPPMYATAKKVLIKHKLISSKVNK